ncbi:MAG: hypothetical protein ACUBOA_02410 [Candidatus Loosdrechtia sp.]|uniref:hypothetical protein n=1 Tax=Candidatus Loosdrechtia sp. TaxID=3101272 RepID=UPI003A6A6C4B|nr:MAG: hypothetical protein QY305_13770 [Candidatus Jettenia sp. AMX2]
MKMIYSIYQMRPNRIMVKLVSLICINVIARNEVTKQSHGHGKRMLQASPSQ